MIRSLKMDVTGKPRRNPVPVPPKGGKPGAIPNNKVGFNLLKVKNQGLFLIIRLDSTS